MVEVVPSATSRRYWIVIGLAMLGLIGCAVTWFVGHRAVLQVTAATGIPSCEGTTPANHELDTDSGYVETAIPMREGAVCTLTVKVANDSDQTVAIDHVAIPVSGPGASSGFEITMIAGNEVAGGDNVEASATLDLTLDPHEYQLIDFRVVSRGDGCASPGSYAWVEPTIHVSRLLSSRDLRISDFPQFEGTTYTSCDS